MNNAQLVIFIYAKTILYGLLINIGFIILDGIWLSALPYLGISYGEVPFSLAIFAFLRGGLFILSLFIIVTATIIRRGVPPQNIVALILGLNIVLLLLGIYSYCIEPMELTIGRFEVQVPGLSHSIRIVQLSDIHVERTTRRELAIPGIVNNLQPDMIVLTGDYLNESYTQSLEAIHDLRMIISQLHAPLGIYAVNGNVETPAEMDELLKGLDIKTLKDETVRFPGLDDHFAILGLSYTNLYYDEANLRNLMTQTRPGDFTLLLYHKPDLAYVAQDLRINLYLTGHTHGGQVRLPFYGALYTNSRYGKTFEMGLYHLGQTTMYVTRGIGMVGGDGPRVRFLCPPEIVVFDLIPSKTSASP